MKTKTQTHTPGPWTLARGDIERGYSHRVETVDSFTGKPAKIGSHAASPICSLHAKAIAGMTEANGRLIAAAPELLAALRGMQRAIENYSAEFNPSNKPNKVCDWAAFNADLCAASAAIAKAEGK